MIASAQNIGFGQGNNIVAKHARGRRLLLLNPDTVILDHAIDRLHEFAIAHPECRIWGGRTLFANGTLNPTSCWRRPTLWSVFCFAVGLTTLKRSNLFNAEGYGDWKRDTVRPVDIVTGCFLLIDRDLWRLLKGFDPAFFMYGEEADLCLRANLLGARPTILPTATIIHYDGASETDETDRRIEVLAGRVTLMRRHWSDFSYHIGRGLYHIAPLSRWLIYGAAGIMFANTKYRQKAQVWSDVWRGRRRWIDGWRVTSR